MFQFIFFSSGLLTKCQSVETYFIKNPPPQANSGISKYEQSVQTFFKKNSPAQAYSGLLQLITLDLSKNNLTWIPPGDKKIFEQMQILL